MLDPETYSIERLPPNHGSHGGSAHGEEKKLCPHIASAAELQSKIFEPVQYVVPGYIAEGATILAGRPKLGKSWLMLDVGLAVARGGSCLGDIRCDEGDVLYLALEDNERRLQSRITKLIGACGNDWPARFYYSTEWPRSEDGGLENVRVWLKAREKPRLVVVDVLAAFRSPRKREDTLYEGDYAAVKELQRIASEMEVAIVIVHHLRKSAAEIDPFEKVSGTLGLSGAADTVLVLDRDGNGATLYGRGRDIEEIETAVDFDQRTCRWRILGNATDVRRTDERRAILFVLSEADEPLPPKEIMIEAELTNRNALDILLHKMVKAGEVTKAGRGLYWHPEKGPPPGKNEKKQRTRGKRTHKDDVSNAPESEPSPRRKERRKERKERLRSTDDASKAGHNA